MSSLGKDALKDENVYKLTLQRHTQNHQ